MNKPDLIKAIAEHGKMGRAEAEIALLAVQHTIREALANGRRRAPAAIRKPASRCRWRPNARYGLSRARSSKSW